MQKNNAVGLFRQLDSEKQNLLIAAIQDDLAEPEKRFHLFSHRHLRILLEEFTAIQAQQNANQ